MLHVCVDSSLERSSAGVYSAPTKHRLLSGIQLHRGSVSAAVNGRRRVLVGMTLCAWCWSFFTLLYFLLGVTRHKSKAFYSAVVLFYFYGPLSLRQPTGATSVISVDGS